MLVITDLLGLGVEPLPRFARAYADLHGEITRAVSEFARDVESGSFPADEHGYR